MFSKSVQIGWVFCLFCWCKCKCSQSCQTRQDPLTSCIISVFLSCFLIECGPFLFVIVRLASGNAPFDIYIIFWLLATEGAVLSCFKSLGCCTCDSLANFITGISTNLSVNHFCWLVIGIMINPAWGLAVLLIVCVFVIALTLSKRGADIGIIYASR